MTSLVPSNTVRSALLACALAATGCSAEERAWQSAERQGTVASYERFLSQYPGSARAHSALEKIWSLVEQAHSVAAYERFLHSHAEAEALADRAVAAIWKLTTEEGSTEAYERFLAKHGESQQAEAAIQALWKQTTVAHTIGAYAAFLAKHPRSSYSEKASRTLAGLWAGLTPQSPTCTLSSNLTVNVRWEPVDGATGYAVESSRLPAFPATKTRRTETETPFLNQSDRVGAYGAPFGQPIRTTGGMVSRLVHESELRLWRPALHAREPHRSRPEDRPDPHAAGCDGLAATESVHGVHASHIRAGHLVALQRPLPLDTAQNPPVGARRRRSM